LLQHLEQDTKHSKHSASFERQGTDSMNLKIKLCRNI
jgi:hypothetical protein